MDELRQKVTELTESWKKISEAMQASPQAWQPHLPYSSPAELDEVLSMISYLLDRTRAPSGFAPTFRLAKGFAVTSLTNALASAKQLEAAQYQHFPNFLIYLNQILSAFLTLLRFSDTDQSRTAIEELGGKLSESLGLLGTAQRELSNKLQLLSEAEKTADTIKEKAESVNTYASESKTKLEAITQLHTSAEQSAAEIESHQKEIEALKQRLDGELTRNSELTTQLEAANKKLSDLQKESKDVDELIHALLPDAASAGLAAAFAKRVTQLERTKWIWMFVFLASILGLVVMAFVILYQNHQASQELWKVVLQRLPFTAPLVWLGWFSAVQYGNTVRVQEDYAFKEATAKAFVGYKDHMDHLADVNIEDTKTAMLMLASKTIEILSHEPLRVYQKSSEDATPAKSFFESLKAGSKQKPDNPTK